MLAGTEEQKQKNIRIATARNHGLRSDELAQAVMQVPRPPEPLKTAITMF
jgi:hypothetical protein